MTSVQVGPRGRSRRFLIQRLNAGVSRRTPDEVAVEEAMEIRLDGVLAATTMRTPGHDYELAAGFCFTDGLLAGAPVMVVRYCATGSAVETGFNVVTVDTGGRAPEPVARLALTTGACGVCGSLSPTDLVARLGPLPVVSRPGFDVLVELAERVRPMQVLYTSTGSVHGAAACAPTGEPLVVREDIGRHNAVDKVVGRLLLDGRLPATGLGLFVSGRAGFELVQKAWAAGFTWMLAVGAPSSLAVETARVAGLGLAGFARGGQVNVYSPEGGW